MRERRVAVTGVGVLSALGANSDEFWTRLSGGISGIRPIESIAPGTVRFLNGAELVGFQALEHFEEKQAALLDRFAQIAMVAARQAVRAANFCPDGILRDTTAVITGSCSGGQTSLDEGFVEMYRKNSPRVSPVLIPKVMGNAAASHITMAFGLRGPAYTISTACASSSHAIGQAYWMVRHGMAGAAIAGGSEAVFSYGYLKSWEAMRVVAPDTCRPFSLDRKGMILGEGAAMLILEPLESALARGAPILAEICGFGMSSDAHHITQPSPEGAALAIRAALSDAQVSAEAVGYINAHGTGTRANDVSETATIRKAFGSHSERVAVSSTKSMHGHTLGAAGAIEAVATVLALHHKRIPPTANFTEADPECDLDVTPNVGRDLEVDVALSNSFAFGGLNAVLAFRRYR